MTLQERVEQMKRAQAVLPDRLYRIAEDATLRAVEKAAELTPPTENDLTGTHTRAGEMKAHWPTDSKTKPMGAGLSGGSTLVTVLANNMQYASYVNDGHRLDRHFVPGLYINPYSGLLEYDAMYGEAGGGIVVGTKTSYVPGLFMVDAAEEVYRETVREEADKLLKELLV